MEQLPTENMVITGFEAVSLFQRTDEYKAMTGCHGAAESARVCWAAMCGAFPDGGTPRQDVEPSDGAIIGILEEISFAAPRYEDKTILRVVREALKRYGKGAKDV